MNKKNYNYAFLFYDVGENRVAKIFKICKKYFVHHQRSVFRGSISPSNLMSLKSELKKVIRPNEDFITIIKLMSDSYYEEETLGTNANNAEDLIL